MVKKLIFAKGNAKLANDTAIFSLPAGHSCPFAKQCKSHSDRITGKVTDGKDCKFRCYAVTPENLFPTVRQSRWDNFDLIRQAKTVIGMASLIEAPLLGMRKLKLVRINQSGDFFNQAYFDAWVLVAKQHPEWIFYGYTKALPFWAKRLGSIPPNMKLVASRGGTHDILIDALGLRSAKVVLFKEEAKDLGLELDHDDTLCWKGNKDFAILIHGTQPAGSLAGKAWYKLFKHGTGGYRSKYFASYDKAKEKTLKGVKVCSTPIKKIKSVKPSYFFTPKSHYEFAS